MDAIAKPGIVQPFPKASTSTLSEHVRAAPTPVANRPTRDERTLEAMSPEVRDSYLAIRTQIDSVGSGPFGSEALSRAMAFEREFVEAGGLLAAGSPRRRPFRS